LRDDRIVATRLRGALRAELGVTPEVVLVPFGTLERTTFKAKRIEEMPSEVPNPLSNFVGVSDGLSRQTQAIRLEAALQIVGEREDIRQ
jgi:hypothetical protein